MITQDKLKYLFEYDCNTGLLYRKRSVSNNTKCGEIPGTVDSRGYISIKVEGKYIRMHQVIWLYHYGYMPISED